jgi:hypothetical protein
MTLRRGLSAALLFRRITSTRGGVCAPVIGRGHATSGLGPVVVAAPLNYGASRSRARLWTPRCLSLPSACYRSECQLGGQHRYGRDAAFFTRWSVYAQARSNRALGGLANECQGVRADVVERAIMHSRIHIIWRLPTCSHYLFDILRLSGAQGRNRTTDTVIFSHVLYQLSYLGAGSRWCSETEAGAVIGAMGRGCPARGP